VCPALVNGGGGGEVGGLGKAVEARLVRRAEAEAGGGGGTGLEPRLAIKKPTQKNLKKPTKNVFFGVLKFLIFYENNTNFSFRKKFFMNK
jgi:hypothetical protein